MALVLFQVLCLVLVAVVLAPALAHALELPGKLRLAREDYLKVQPIYYPGFTYAGMAEPVAVLALLLLAVLTPTGTPAFWLSLGAFAALAAAHLVYWLRTHPVNAFWLRGEGLEGRSARFFRAGSREPEAGADWRAMRDQWEHSHLIRAACAFAAFVLLAAAVAL